jgi:hypothetical protein
VRLGSTLAVMWVLAALPARAQAGVEADLGPATDGGESAAEQSADAGADSLADAGVPIGSGQLRPGDEGWQPNTWGEFDPGKGFQVAKTPAADLWISAYALLRYLNQLPPDQTFVDHLGVTRPVKARNDIQFHRGLVHFRGFVFLPKLTYVITVWTVLSNDLIKLIGTLSYAFHKAFSLSAGIDGLPGIRTLVGSHPLWLGHDRTMAEEFARPGFTAAVFATGEPLRGLNYKLSVGNNISQLGLNASLLTRDLAVAGSLWWMPTTAEFGPRGGQGDYERHEKLATRFGVSTTRALEAHYTPLDQPPASTQVRTADGVPLFETGALAKGVTLERARYQVLSIDAGLKYLGIYLQAEVHFRWLSEFVADGPLPVSGLFDKSFFVLGSFFIIQQRWELYGGTSWVFGDPAAGFRNQFEVIAGSNVYPADTRNFRLNVHTIYVDRSAAGGTFGYYSTGQKGPTISVACSIFF